MNILVLGGSPKGEKSVTMQYVKWLEQNASEHIFDVVQVAQSISKLERQPETLAAIAEKARAADGVLWAFPLYVATVHAGVKRFIELVGEHGLTEAFQGRHAAILTTSIHFFDHTAVEYVRGISEDWGMCVDEVFSADMGDLTQADGPHQLSLFLRKWIGAIQSGRGMPRRTAPILHRPTEYLPDNRTPVRRPIRVGIVTQSGVSANLDRMVERISSHFEAVELYDLSTMHIAGNCTGCMRCAYDNHCMYEGKDDIISTYRSLRSCDAVLFCGFVVDRYFSARWKTFIDRMFFSTHIPVLPGMPIGFVVSGPLRQHSNLQNMLEGVYGAMRMPMAGFVSDEGEHIDDNLEALASSLHFLAAEGYTPPALFPAVAGQKIFRDKIFGELGIFVADYHYYRKNGYFDFPHRQFAHRLSGALMRVAMKIPSVRKNMQENMKDNMLLSFRRVVK